MASCPALHSTHSRGDEWSAQVGEFQPAENSAGRLASPPKISNPDIDDDKAREYQGEGRPGRGSRASRGLRPLGRRALEGGDVIRDLIVRTGFDVGRYADAAHLAIVTLVNDADGRFGRLGLRHLLEKRLVADQERLGFGA